MRPTWHVLVFVLLGLACFGVVSAPLPKTPAPPLPLKDAVVGRFTLHWGGATYDCEIDRDGCWECRGGSTTWIGGVEVRGDRVILSEAVLDPLTLTTGEERHYEIVLDGNLSGHVVDGVAVRLERRLGQHE